MLLYRTLVTDALINEVEPLLRKLIQDAMMQGAGPDWYQAYGQTILSNYEDYDKLKKRIENGVAPTEAMDLSALFFLLFPYWAQKAVSEGSDNAAGAQSLLDQIKTYAGNRLNEGVNHYREGRFGDAFAAFREAAQAGNVTAMNNMAACYDNGQGVPQNQAEAFRWTKAAAEEGYAASYYFLARRYFSGNGTNVDLAQAKIWAERAVQSSPNFREKAQALLQSIQNKGANQGTGSRVDEAINLKKQGRFQEAAAINREEAEKGVPAAMHNLANCYESGEGVPQDREESFRWMKAAAEKGLIPSFYALAIKYFRGNGTEPDLDLAETWLDKYFKNTPNPPQYAVEMRENIRWMKQGSRISLPREAINNYLNGHNLMLKKQYAQGLPLLELAGRAGHPEALCEIGDAYMAGNGVTVNVTNAYQFYQAAAFRGDAAALRTIATNLRGIITMFPWKMYAQYSKMSRCDNVYDNAVRQHISEQNDPNNKSVAGPSSPSARDAMLSMATARKNGITTMDFHGHTSRTLDPRVRTYMSNAAVWGDLDGLCLYTEMFAKGNPNSTERGQLSAMAGFPCGSCKFWIKYFQEVMQMGKIVLYLALSVDGYLADEQGGVDWLGGDGSQPDAPGSYPEFYAGVDAVVMGWTTYHQIVTQLSPDSWPYKGRPCYVVTHRQEKSREGVCFWAGEPAVLADKLKAECAGTIWICGGASVAGQLLEEDRIDRLWLSVVPVVLGKGVRLFPELSQSLPLKLIETQSYNGIVDLIYEKR